MIECNGKAYGSSGRGFLFSWGGVCGVAMRNNDILIFLVSLSAFIIGPSHVLSFHIQLSLCQVLGNRGGMRQQSCTGNKEKGCPDGRFTSWN